AARKRDHDRVVARQQDIDPDDLDRGDPELRCAEFHASPPLGSAVLRAPPSTTPYNTDCKSFPISAGLRVTRMPHSSMTASFSCAVPLPPEMMAPACPIRFPGGAVTPAMKPTTGFFMFSFTQRAAVSSSDPPISPIMTT